MAHSGIPSSGCARGGARSWWAEFQPASQRNSGRSASRSATMVSSWWSDHRAGARTAVTSSAVRPDVPQSGWVHCRRRRAVGPSTRVMAQWGIGTIRIPSPHRGGSRGPVRLLAIGQPPGLPALPEQGPLPRVPPRGGRHPPDGRIMHPTGSIKKLPRSAGLCRRASEPIRRER